jgi:uncharacterized protein YdgA (DUF945 family)
MFGLINPLYKIIGIIGLLAILFGFGYYRGYSAEKERFDAFKAEIEASVKAQEKINQQIEQKNKLIANNIKSEYETKLAALRNHYSFGLRNNNSTKLPPLSSTSYRVDAASTDPIFIGQCSETTLMLTSLQEWIRAVNEK